MISRTGLAMATLFASLVAPLAACTKQPEPAAKADAPVSFAAQSSIPVTLTLLGAEAETARTSPISSQYRPQVRFPLGAVETSCTVTLPAETPALEPGQSSAATLACDATVQVARDDLAFGVFEGGKQVGTGTVTLQ